MRAVHVIDQSIKFSPRTASINQSHTGFYKTLVKHLPFEKAISLWHILKEKKKIKINKNKKRRRIAIVVGNISD